ncbi:hypothetical protein AB1L30_01320 [Bremerella sp. JC817]|uniref:hypothetical protein n=1 Tax=Bremerella sp. JC817 TaxID=3231756 RepID=UPI0034577744
MDVVYFLKHSQFEDVEIRYSLRSIARHCPWVRKVWVFGDRPLFLSEDTTIVEHVPHDTFSRALGFPNPMTNFFQMLFSSSLIPELDSEYLWFCDDFFVIKDWTIEQARTLRYLQDMDSLQRRGRGLWLDSLWRTYDVLRRFKLPRLNYETHVPTYYRKHWPLEAYAQFRDFVTDDRWYGLLGPTAILNHAVAKNGLTPICIKDEGCRAGFWGESPSFDDVVVACHGRQFLNFDDKAMGPGIRQYLDVQFPERSKYEKPDA